MSNRTSPASAQQLGDDDAPIIDRTQMAYELDQGLAPRAAIGLIVLATDQTIEHEFRRLLDLPGVALYQSRLGNSASITPETLKQMEAGIATAAGLILPDQRLDVIAYGCTSGAMVIGRQAVNAKIHQARPGIPCSDPMTAALAAFQALGVGRIALLTPYVDAINQAMRRHLQDRGLAVPVMGSFNEEDDGKVARISPDSLSRAALELGQSDAVEAIFVSCTNLRLLDVLRELEAELGKPVTSSNHALAWHCLRLAGIDDPLPQHGRLFAHALTFSTSSARKRPSRQP